MNALSLAGRPFMPGASRVTVIGAGVMGPGIAQVFAEQGFEVDLCESGQPALDRGMASLKDSLALKVELSLLDDRLSQLALARVTPHYGIEAAVARADLIIEAVTENRTVKKNVYERVDRLAGSDAVVWSNTSTLNVFELAPPALAPRLLVAHWFAPPQILPLVEVVGSPQGRSGLCEETVTLLRALGKTPVVLEKFIPGFLINRLLRALGRESFNMIESGVVSVEDLDVAVRTSLAPRMQLLGVMQRYDFTGLGLSLRNLADPDMVDAPIDLAPTPLRERVDRGDLGVSSGKGFYDYEGRSMLEMQRQRDRKLWQIMTGLSDLVLTPKPL
jgi:3-hydroxybutyryl-CoA dehydrogenase